MNWAASSTPSPATTRPRRCSTFARGVNATQILVGAAPLQHWRRGQSATLAERIDPDARTAVTDAGLLDRVLVNVAENALRYQPGGSPVGVRASRVTDRVEIRDVDNGAGVPHEAQETILQPFQRPGDVPSGDGLSLGLAVARELTQSMGGRGCSPNPPPAAA